MREGPTVVAIGAGSASFGLTVVHDVYADPVLTGATLWLVDVDRARLDRMRRVGERLEAATGRGIRLRSTDDRRDALPDADVVIVAAEVNRDPWWRLDWEIPRRHGIDHVLGENAGPGGLSHALRTIPLVAEIGRDVGRLAPDALLLNYTNPEGRVCTAFRRHLDVPIVGLCHEVQHATNRLADALDLPADRVQWRAAGLNHITWLLGAADRATGDDLTHRIRPALDRVLAGHEGFRHRLVAYLADRFGRVVATTDTHVGEYLAYAGEHLAATDFWAEQADMRTTFERLVEGVLTGSLDLDGFLRADSNEAAVAIVRAMITGERERIASAILPNDGLITGLPADCAVEVSATATATGPVGDRSDDLPPAVVALLAQEVAIQQLVAEAALCGSRDAALQALLLDPVVGSSRRAEAVLADFEAAYTGVWPVLH